MKDEHQISKYIELQKEKGFSDDDIRTSLQGKGWPDSEINKYLGAGDSGIEQPIASRKSYQGLPGVTPLLQESWKRYKKNWLVFSGIFAVFAFLPFFFAFLIFLLNSVFSVFLTEEMVIYFDMLATFLVLPIQVLASFLGLAALMMAVIKGGAQEKFSEIFKYFRGGMKKVAPLLWVSFLSGVLTSLGYIFFIIPGIIFFVWFLFDIFVVVNEDVRGIEALKKSREYVRGYWWAVFGRVLAVGFFFMVIMIFASALSFVVDMVVSGLSGAVSEIAGGVVLIAFMVPVMPVAFIYYYLLYKNIKEIKEEN